MKIRMIAAALGAVFLWPIGISAAPLCLPRSELAVHLAENYGETLIAQGLDNRGALIELFAAPSRERWTLTETDVDGRSCLIAAGEYWNGLHSRPVAARQPAAFDPRANDNEGGSP